MSTFRNFLLALAIAVSAVISALCFWLWYERYLSIDFNELGRFYDARQGVVYTDAAFAWCLPGLGFLLTGIALAIRWKAR